MLILLLWLRRRAGVAAIDVAIPNGTVASVSERISVSSLLEVVSDDLLTLNNNLKSVSFLLCSAHSKLLWQQRQHFSRIGYWGMHISIRSR